MGDNKLNIIIIILVAIIVILSIGGVILYITTDLLKPKDLLFKKYISQNVGNIIEVFDISKETNLVDWIQNNDYTESTEMKLKYRENQNDEEEVYTLIEKGSVNNTDNNSYKRISIDYQNENLMRIETLKQNEKYGVRLPNLIQQFISVENKNLSYFISSMGYQGKYFSEQLERVNLSGIISFSDEEVKTLTETYTNLIFSDINIKNYTSKRNEIRTLNNGESITANSYSLTLTQTELDKIYKKILNQVVKDEIILSKIRQIDEKIKETGIIEAEGESLEENFIKMLQETSNKFEYKGENNNKVIFTVFESKGVTVRTSIQTDTKTYLLDLDTKSDFGMSLKEIKLTENGEETKLYSLDKGKVDGEILDTIKYQDDGQNINIILKAENQDDGVNIESNIEYSNNNMYSIKLETNSSIEKEQGQQSAVQFDENNNILLNNYDFNRVQEILLDLKNRIISSLSDAQLKINTKLLNNILVWVDNKEQTIARQEEELAELQKQAFNNQFILYAGQELNDEHVKKLLNVASKNMSEYQIINGNKIRIIIKEGEQNEERAKEIEQIVTNRYKYNIDINYSENGWVESIDISTFQRN